MGKKLGDEVRKKLQQKTEQFLDKEKKDRESREKEQQKENENRRIAEQEYLAWYEKRRIQFENSAKIIWDWYREFVASENFREIVESTKNTRARILKISDIVGCSMPSRWRAGQTEREKQILSIGIANAKLSVHDCVKYGRSYQINGVPDLLKYVKPPILINVAGTITDDIIWNIIDFGNFEL